MVGIYNILYIQVKHTFVKLFGTDTLIVKYFVNAGCAVKARIRKALIDVFTGQIGSWKGIGLSKFNTTPDSLIYPVQIALTGHLVSGHSE